MKLLRNIQTYIHNGIISQSKRGLHVNFGYISSSLPNIAFIHTPKLNYMHWLYIEKWINKNDPHTFFYESLRLQIGWYNEKTETIVLIKQLKLRDDMSNACGGYRWFKFPSTPRIYCAFASWGTRSLFCFVGSFCFSEIWLRSIVRTCY